MSRRLAQTLATAQQAQPGVMRTVTVVDVTAGQPPTLTVTFADGATPITGVRYLDSFTPGVGESCVAWCQGKTVLVIGRLA